MALKQENLDGAFVAALLLLAKFSPNFDLKNMISTYTKDENFMRKIAQICQFFILKNFKLSDVYDNFEVGSQVFFCFSQFSYLVCNQSNQIWLNYFMVGRHFDYITKP